MSADVIETLAGIAPGAFRRPQAREQAQASFDALFDPADPTGVTPEERFAVAAFVAGLHGGEAAAFYRSQLQACGAGPALAAAVDAEITRGRTTGPYGAYPAGPLSREDVAGMDFAASHGEALGARIAAALGHAHMLVYHPRDASAEALRRLERAGWLANDIVTLSQLVAFLSFQLRVVHGLRILAGSAA